MLPCTRIHIQYLYFSKRHGASRIVFFLLMVVMIVEKERSDMEQKM